MNNRLTNSKETPEDLIHLFKSYPQLKECFTDIYKAYLVLLDCFISENKLLVCGNGGSAADSEHIVGELMKSFKKKRAIKREFAENYIAINKENPPEYLEGAVTAISLVSQMALLTAFSNDKTSRGYFAQQVYGYGRENDVLLCISTSGNSLNVVDAAKVAKAKNMRVISFTGCKDSKLSVLSDVCVQAPETETYKIQELHLPIYHAICAAIESELFSE